MDSTKLGLTELADRPELTVTIGGQEYHFGEMLIEEQADIEAWLKRNVPHPLEAIKAHLEGMPEKVAIGLAEHARQEAKTWPPRVGSLAASGALMAREEGQLLALQIGLRKFHPELTREHVQKLYKQLEREAVKEAREAKARGEKQDGEGIINRIFLVIFGHGDPAHEDQDRPKV